MKKQIATINLRNYKSTTIIAHSFGCSVTPLVANILDIERVISINGLLNPNYLNRILPKELIPKIKNQKINQPVIQISCTNDPIIPFWLTNKICNSMKNLCHIKIRSGDHAVTDSVMNVVEDALTSFLTF